MHTLFPKTLSSNGEQRPRKKIFCNVVFMSQSYGVELQRKAIKNYMKQVISEL